MGARGVKRLSALFALSLSQNLAWLFVEHKGKNPGKILQSEICPDYSSSSSVVPISVASSAGTRGTACPAKYC